MDNIYITKTAHFLPNDPVANDEIEQYLGEICHKSSRAKAIVLRNNRITNRYYALTKDNEITHTNAELTYASIKQLFNDSFQPSQLELLSVGTSSPDTMMPSHGLLVHSLIEKINSIPVYSAAGVCCSSMHAFEIAYMALKTGKVSNAIATGSELLSPMLRSNIFEIEGEKLIELGKNPIIAFEKDFLRFMLSDGSGAFLLENRPRPGLNYKIEWVEAISYANELPACMFQGCVKNEDGKLKSWKNIDPHRWEEESVFAIKQDTRILENIIPKAIQFIDATFKKYNILPQSINYFLPHISSMYFYDKLTQALKENDILIADDAFYCCLPEIGNIGSASIYATLDRLSKEKELKEGDVIVLGVPESGQFQYSFVMLTVTYK